MSDLPIFGPEGARWSLGSQVDARWFERDAKTGDAFEVVAIGRVIGIRKPPHSERWVVSLTFGPVLDVTHDTEFAPEQITARHD